MAIDTDQLKKGSRGFGGTQPQAHSNTPEGGSDMALALTSTIQGQANQLAIAAQAADISIDHASTEMARYFTEVMSGRALLNAILAKTAANLEAMGGPVTINTEVAPVTINLPQSGDFGATRRNFLGLFGGDAAPTNPFLAAAAEITAADEVAGDE